MKPNPLLGLVLLLLTTSIPLLAQEDTTVVQVISFDDGLDNRRAWRIFPPDTTTYRKVLMYQTLKCDPSLISNPTGSGCGEWDTGENFYIFDHSYADSLRYRVGFTYPEEINYLTTPTYSTIEEYEYFIEYDATISESAHSVGSGSTPLNHTLQTSLHTSRAQYLYLGSELAASGMVAGSIDKLEIDVTALGLTTLSGLQIRMKETSLTEITADSYETEDLVTVYDLETTITGTGIHTFNLTYPFDWDGSSNIVIDLSFTNDATSSDFSITGESTTFSSAVFATQDDQYFHFHGNGYVDVETSSLKPLLDSSITISFWTQTMYDGAVTHLIAFSAIDTANIYQMLNRLPSTHPRVQWYAGRELDAGLDNISTADLSDYSDFDGGWTHWAFTRAADSEMNIYRNGEAYLTGLSGNTMRIIDRVEEFRIAADRASNNTFYNGYMNEFRIWNEALDQVTIQDWMYKDVDGTHPNFTDLVGYFKFDVDGVTFPVDETGVSSAYGFGMPSQHYVKGENRFRNLGDAMERPNITFIQGDYLTSIDSNLVITTYENPPMSIVVSENYQDLDLIGMQDVELDTLFVWPEGYSYTYDGDGNIIDSTFFTATETLKNWYTGHQTMLCKYITPYGNYLDLGEGFTWIYDVTEYENLLHDTIDLSGGGHRELIDLQFKFIEGTPPQEVNDLQWMHNVGGKYEDIVATPEDYYNEITADPGSDRFGIRASFSGHGFSNPTNCAEFCQRDHFIELDGDRAYEWVHWKECSDNPLYPQGGTWIYDRSGWCPGAPQDIYHFDLTDWIDPGESKTLFKGVDPDPTGTEYGTWGGFMWFIGYSDPNFATDATVYDIIAPNNHDEYLRFNPICDNAVIVLRNNGSNTMTSATIEYSISGGILQTYEWTGSLEFMESEEVVLPMHSKWHWMGDETKFTATVTKVNGAADDYAQNNSNHSWYSPPPSHEGELEIWLRANSMGSQSSWDIQDGFGNILYEETDFEANELRKTPVSLPDGCYVFNVYDTGDNGLSFWANSEGNGYCQLRKGEGGLIKAFEADFGDNIRYEFSVGGVMDTPEHELGERFMSVYPNPSKGVYNIALDNFDGEQVTVEVYDMLGQSLSVSSDYQILENHFVTKIDLTNASSGLYTIVVRTKDSIWTERVQKN